MTIIVTIHLLGIHVSISTFKDSTHAVSGVKMTGKLGKGALSLRDIVPTGMVVQLQIDI